MAKEVRTVAYIVRNVTSLAGLADMMRYDGMRFGGADDTREMLAAIKRLALRDEGIIDRNGPDDITLRLFKDCTRLWMPTVDRWRSFGMTIEPEEGWAGRWSECGSRTIN